MKNHIYFKRYIKNIPNQMKEITFFSEGEKYWRLNDDLHREDGPAYEGYNGYKEWWLNNEEYSEYEYKKALEEYKKEQIG